MRNVRARCDTQLRRYARRTNRPRTHDRLDGRACESDASRVKIAAYDAQSLFASLQLSCERNIKFLAVYFYYPYHVSLLFTKIFNLNNI